MALPVGAAILSLCVFLLLLAGAASATSFLALGICAQLPHCGDAISPIAA